MNTYRIADLTVKYDSFLEPLKGRSRKYLVDDDTADAVLTIKREELIGIKKEADESCDWGMCEYILMTGKFYTELIDHNGMMLHASAVVVDDRAYLFSAPSGTGKSTHTQLWLDYFGKDKAYIINDDKPAIRIFDGVPYVYGTPFSGKYDINENKRVKLKGICFLERAEHNSICRLADDEILLPLLNETIRPKDPEKMSKLMQTIDLILNTTPVYKLACNISQEAVKLSYKAMSGRDID